MANCGGFCGGINGCLLAARYNHGYTSAMKTAISIPDAIFEEAERLAKKFVGDVAGRQYDIQVALGDWERERITKGVASPTGRLAEC